MNPRKNVSCISESTLTYSVALDRFLKVSKFVTLIQQ